MATYYSQNRPYQQQEYQHYQQSGQTSMQGMSKFIPPADVGPQSVGDIPLDEFKLRKSQEEAKQQQLFQEQQQIKQIQQEQVIHRDLYEKDLAGRPVEIHETEQTAALHLEPGQLSEQRQLLVPQPPVIIEKMAPPDQFANQGALVRDQYLGQRVSVITQEILWRTLVLLAHIAIVVTGGIVVRWSSGCQSDWFMVFIYMFWIYSIVAVPYYIGLIIHLFQERKRARNPSEYNLLANRYRQTDFNNVVVFSWYFIARHPILFAWEILRSLYLIAVLLYANYAYWNFTPLYGSACRATSDFHGTLVFFYVMVWIFAGWRLWLLAAMILFFPCILHEKRQNAKIRRYHEEFLNGLQVLNINQLPPESLQTTVCPVCGGLFKEGEQMVRTPCNFGHLYHRNCLGTFIPYTSSCLVCNQSIIKYPPEGGKEYMA